MLPGKRSQLQYEHSDDRRRFWRTYTLDEPVAMGYNDPPEVIGLGDGRGPAFKIPPEAFEYLAVTYLRLHGWFCVRPGDVRYNIESGPAPETPRDEKV